MSDYELPADIKARRRRDQGVPPGHAHGEAPREREVSRMAKWQFHWLSPGWMKPGVWFALHPVKGALGPFPSKPAAQAAAQAA